MKNLHYNIIQVKGSENMNAEINRILHKSTDLSCRTH